jgi:hypothetical protein
MFLLSAASRPVLGCTQLPTKYVRVALSPGVKWPGREADYSPPSSAEVKNAWSYTSTPSEVFMAWCYLSTGKTLPSHLNQCFCSVRNLSMQLCKGSVIVLYELKFLTKNGPPQRTKVLSKKYELKSRSSGL